MGVQNPNEYSIRMFRSEDEEGLLRLIRLNTPAYFAPEEAQDYKDYLENEREKYFVAIAEDTVIAGGGINFKNEEKAAWLSWDLVHPYWQGKGVGGAIVQQRIQYIREHNSVQQIVVRTSQFAWKFYEKQGFDLVQKVDDYWAKGYHLYLMKMGVYDQIRN
ncbi:GNAT family N-acetyltransferase [Roseivirga sp. BDSF3-8]|uniref:GNAT family N-acetyltransferase n=1 Tax=Roseivirga sp. BDSF3-8 TaxID=3241598 RepID=UPI003531EDDD